MWDAIDARLYEEFGIHSGVNRLKKKIQNIQAGARGKIEALRLVYFFIKNLLNVILS